MVATKSRVVGSGFTTFTYNGQPIAYLTNVNDSGQAAYGGTSGTGYEVVISLGDSYPSEVATSRVRAIGTLTCVVRELWNAPAWNQLQGLAGTNNIIDVFEAVAALPGPGIQAVMVIKPQGSTSYRGWTYNNILPVDIGDGETVSLGALTMTRNLTLLYTNRVPLTASGPALP